MAAPTPAEIADARRDLVQRDPALARAHAAVPDLEWRLRPGGFEGLFRMIVEQQVSVAAASAIWGRVVQALGDVTAEAVLARDAPSLRSLGLSVQKARYGLEIAEAHARGDLDWARLNSLSDEEAVAELTALRGVGRWTAETFLMFCEGRRDVFPAADIALQEAMRWADGGELRAGEKEARARAEAWRPHRSVAAHLLWGWYGRVRRGEIALEAPAA